MKVSSELWQKMFVEYMRLVVVDAGTDFLDDPEYLAVRCGGTAEEVSELKRIVAEAREQDGYKFRFAPVR